MLIMAQTYLCGADSSPQKLDTRTGAATWMRTRNKIDSIGIPLLKALPENRPNSIREGVLSGPVADEAVESGQFGDSAVPGQMC